MHILVLPYATPKCNLKHSLRHFSGLTLCDAFFISPFPTAKCQFIHGMLLLLLIFVLRFYANIITEHVAGNDKNDKKKLLILT